MRATLRRALLAFVLLAPLLPTAAAAADRLIVTWHPARPKVGDVAWLQVRGASEEAVIEGSVGDRTLLFFPYADGHAALVGFDSETKPGPVGWRLAAMESGHAPRLAEGSVPVGRRDFKVQRLTLPPAMVDLDPEVERRAVSEAERLQTLYRTITPERLWRGRFTRPVAGTEPGTGFGARRVINGKPRSPHSGIDYAVERGTPVVAVNSGRVALIADYFFQGRFIVLDHGLGLYSLYFHLDSVTVVEGEAVDRGHTIGTVGSTGRATGPHLHFAAHVAGSRIDPAALLGLKLLD